MKNPLLHSVDHLCFDKRMTAMIKGVAILFMMLLHCYGKEAYDVMLNFDYVLIPGSRSVLKICVGMFTFLVGYGYSFSKTKDWRYSLSHVKKLLIPFWVILFVFTFPVCFSEVMSTSPLVLFYNLFGIDSHFNWYSWYVAFYIFAMLVMPSLSRFIDRRPLLNTAIAVVVAYLLCVAVHAIPGVLTIKPLLLLFDSLMMMPIMLVGYLFAHERFFERFSLRRFTALTLVIISLLMISVVFILKYYKSSLFAFQFDTFYAPALIGALVILFHVISWRPLHTVLAKLGEVSVYMWFLHALFFTTPVRWFYQPAITIFKDINLVVLWAIVLTFVASWLIKSVVDACQRQLSKWATHPA